MAIAPEVRGHHVRKQFPTRLSYNAVTTCLLDLEEYEDVSEHQDARQL
jgi:hypothetical protein